MIKEKCLESAYLLLKHYYDDNRTSLPKQSRLFEFDTKSYFF